MFRNDSLQQLCTEVVHMLDIICGRYLLPVQKVL